MRTPAPNGQPSSKRQRLILPTEDVMIDSLTGDVMIDPLAGDVMKEILLSFLRRYKLKPLYRLRSENLMDVVTFYGTRGHYDKLYEEVLE